jgi:tRNA(His) guanylyltransferase
LVQEGKQTATQAHEALCVSIIQECGGGHRVDDGRKGTNSAQKNQLLFERFGINYNNVPERLRKGTVILREVGVLRPWRFSQLTSFDQVSKDDDALNVGDTGGGGKKRAVTRMTVLHCDLRDEFWNEKPNVLLE